MNHNFKKVLEIYDSKSNFLKLNLKDVFDILGDKARNFSWIALDLEGTGDGSIQKLNIKIDKSEIYLNLSFEELVELISKTNQFINIILIVNYSKNSYLKRNS